MTAALNPYASPEAAELVSEASDAPPSVPKIFAFDGRLGRMRMVAYFFLATLIMLPFATGALLLASESSALGLGLYFAVMLVHTTFSVSLYVRRLHDLDRSGLMTLLMLVPLLNIGVTIYLFCFPGTDGSNRYGTPTVPNSTGVKTAFGLGLAFTVVVPVLAAIAIPAFQQYAERARQAQTP